MLHRQARIDWKRKDFPTRRFRSGELAFLVPKVAKSRLKVEWNRIIDLRRNAALLEEFPNAVARPGSNRELVVHVEAVRGTGRERNHIEQSSFSKEAAVAFRVFA